MTIKNELIELQGVKSVEGDSENKIIRVEWEEPATLTDIEQTLEDINYPASSWSGARIRYLKGGDPMARSFPCQLRPKLTSKKWREVLLWQNTLES